MNSFPGSSLQQPAALSGYVVKIDKRLLYLFSRSSNGAKFASSLLRQRIESSLCSLACPIISCPSSSQEKCGNTFCRLLRIIKIFSPVGQSCRSTEKESFDAVRMYVCMYSTFRWNGPDVCHSAAHYGGPRDRTGLYEYRL